MKSNMCKGLSLGARYALCVPHGFSQAGNFVSLDALRDRKRHCQKAPVGTDTEHK